MSEYRAARDAANVAFAKRVCGMSPPERVRYHRPFDYMAVVNAAPLPNDPLKQRDHDYAWGEMWRIFDEEWKSRND